MVVVDAKQVVADFPLLMAVEEAWEEPVEVVASAAYQGVVVAWTAELEVEEALQEVTLFDRAVADARLVVQALA